MGDRTLPRATFVPEDDLYKVMRQVHMERAIVMGNSSGGALALDFALAHPEMVDGLFLIGPVVHGMASSDYFNERGAKNSAPLEKGDVKGAAENWSRDRFLIGGEDARARKILYEALGPIEAGAPVARLEVWNDVGHLIQIQRPAELVERFHRFVASVGRKEVPIGEQQLRAYAGQYKVGSRTARAFLQQGRLVLEFPGDPYYWPSAASETRFFLRNDDAEIEFTKDAGGRVLELVIHNSDGSVIRCPRADQATGR